MTQARLLPCVPATDADPMVRWLLGIGFIPRRARDDNGGTVVSLVWRQGGGRIFNDRGQPGQSVTYLAADNIAQVLQSALINGPAVVTESSVEGEFVVSGSVRDVEGNVWIFESKSLVRDH